MKCPLCAVDLMMSDRQGIEIDYCPKCRGIWLDRGEIDKALADFDATLKLAPTFAAAYINRGVIWGRKGDHDRALALLDQAMSGPNEKSANEISHLEPWSKPLHHGPRFEAARAKAAPRE